MKISNGRSRWDLLSVVLLLAIATVLWLVQLTTISASSTAQTKPAHDRFALVSTLAPTPQQRPTIAELTSLSERRLFFTHQPPPTTLSSRRRRDP